MLNMCPHTEKTTRHVPIEVHNLRSEVKGYRIDNAPFSTCVQCGASFYDTYVMTGTQTSLEPPKAPMQDNWDC